MHVEHDHLSVVLDGGPANSNSFGLKFQSNSRTFDHVGTTTSYVDVAKDIYHLCALLRSKEVVGGEHVVNVQRRGPRLLATIASLWTMNIVNVPLDYAVPRTRLSSIQKITRAKLCIHDSSFSLEKQIFCTHLNVESQLSQLKISPELFHPSCELKNSETHVCYCIFTSGSTGEPKGVLISQYNLCTYLNGMIKTFEFGTKDVFCCQTSIGFDASINETYMPLVIQASHLSVADSQRLNSKHFVKMLTKYHLTLVQCTPSVWNLLLTELLADRLSFKCVALCGGEKLTAALKSDLLKCFTAVLDQYGPTEATVGCANKLYKQNAAPTDHTNGTPLPGDVLFCCVEGRIASEGESGELVCCGDKVGKYCEGSNVKNKFVKVQLYEQTVSAYFTGDLAKIENFELCILGRADSQVKINGQRVELEEIESCIERMPCIREAICTCDKVLQAYLVLNCTFDAISQDIINDYLANHLPSAWWPCEIFAVPSIKLNQNKKKDRKHKYDSETAEQILPAKHLTVNRPVNVDLQTAMAQTFGKYIAEVPLRMLGNSIKFAQLLNILNSQGYSLDFDLNLQELNAYDISELIENGRQANRTHDDETLSNTDSDVSVAQFHLLSSYGCSSIELQQALLMLICSIWSLLIVRMHKGQNTRITLPMFAMESQSAYKLLTHYEVSRLCEIENASINISSVQTKRIHASAPNVT
eukprot:CAMPEP_0183794022 /NCGR_PEP_ID=MMETSP0803_2-20130417/3594_1 /TAXON_ID=195967 /ORGANISM="Crustomastix stigmata, Strain CCMP3273" /LENGTH=699 /DNA_ID=CAMNT_0026038417 /DNA_START=44 /DNA_END=2142 /DNA_ORIENTATION=+